VLRQAHAQIEEQKRFIEVHVRTIKALQMKLPKEEWAVSKEVHDGMDVTPQMLDPALVSPLVSHYENERQQLKRDIGNLENELGLKRAQVAQLAAENNELRKRQLDDFDALLTKNTKLGMAGHLTGEEALERVNELTERLQYIEGERDVLVKGKELLTDELEQTHKALSEAEQRVFQQGKDLVDLQVARSYLDEVVAEKEVGAKKFGALTVELGEARQAQRRAEEKAGQLSADVAELSALVEGHRKELKQKGKGYEDAYEVLQEKVQTFAARIRDLQQKLAAKMAEAESAGQTARAMARDIEQYKTDNRGMMQLMSGMEKQLNEFAGREALTESVKHECTEMAEHAVLERNQAVATEAYLRNELTKLREVS
jgi:chromosome segregation ATPase